MIERCGRVSLSRFFSGGGVTIAAQAMTWRFLRTRERQVFGSLSGMAMQPLIIAAEM
jgi:hypothetical protein